MKARYGSIVLLVSIASSIVFASGRAFAAEPGGGMGQPYASMLETLGTALKAKIPPKDAAPEVVNKFLASDALDAELVKFVVLNAASPTGLAEFAQQGKDQAAMIDRLLADPVLMLQMLVADGASGGRYGQAMTIYTDIQKASSKASGGVLQRLAVAISLVHAEPVKQVNPAGQTDGPQTVDPVKRYLQYEKAYLGGELDPAFDKLTTWDLRFVVDGEEPDETLVWGRMMLRNFRPDHVLNADYGWRYVGSVPSEVRYGSGDVKFDRPELQNYQNIIMNGGICGRRAWFGRFILRAFGIPTTARPQRGHAALVHWTPNGWVPNLGGGWGAGWTKTIYNGDKNFLATTQARANPKEFLKVKRAQWAGDVMGEKPVYGEDQVTPGFWYGVSLNTQREIIAKSNAQTLAALGEELGESNEPTVAEKIMAAAVAPEDKRITFGPDGVITIPAAAYTKPSGNTGDVMAMKSFEGGMQVFYPRFSRQGVTILRGGAWRGKAEGCKSGARLPSSGFGRYNNWGFRVALTPAGTDNPGELTLDMGDGVKLELVYIKPGAFVMGGENAKDGTWACVEVPKHDVTLTRGFYLGKYEVTQAQYQAVMGANPSAASKDPNCPADTISEGEAVEFCTKLAEKTGKEARLPTEAEWEYACRAGATTAYFFGDDPAKLGDYAWFADNDGGKSHPVGQKKPNPWGLYDIVGNVCERVSDTYAKDYYAKSPKVDPAGPSQGVSSRFEFEFNVPQAGQYTLSAKVVTVNEDQRLNVSANGSEPDITMVMPFTGGAWGESQPVTVSLKEGTNVLRFSRTDPPQYGLAIKSFTLKPAR